MITVAQAVVRCLEMEGVSVAFGYPGAAICPVYDAMSLSSIHHVLVREEQNAAHAASGYARISGKPGVCIATSGPGALNLITGIATAYADSIPMVIITGQVSTELLGRDVFQEADITGAVEPFVKHSYLVKSPEEITRIMKEAFYIASSGRPGPVLVDIPVDVQRVKINFDYSFKPNIRGYKPTVVGHQGQVKRMLSAIKAAKKPVVCAGGGVLSCQAQKELQRFVETMNLPVVTTMMGLGAIRTEHPLNFGMLGMHGQRCANMAVNESDLLVLVGARVGDRAVTTPGVLEKRTKIVHIDIDPAEIGKNVDVSIPIVGDVKTVLNQALEKAESLDHSEWLEELSAYRSAPKFGKGVSGYINPREFIHKLSEKAPDDFIYVADVGQNQIWSASNCVIRNGRFLTSGGMGTMGYSVPAAVGAKMAGGERMVLAVCGDGSFQMQMMELATICQEQLNIKIIVMKNDRLGMVRELQKNNYAGNYIAVFLDGSPDFVKLASAYGIPSASISRPDEIDSAIETLLSSRGPFLLECVVSENESSL